MMSKTQLPHIPEDALELYSMGRLSESEIEGVEEHLLVCSAARIAYKRRKSSSRPFAWLPRELENEPEPQREAQSAGTKAKPGGEDSSRSRTP